MGDLPTRRLVVGVLFGALIAAAVGAAGGFLAAGGIRRSAARRGAPPHASLRAVDVAALGQELRELPLPLSERSGVVAWVKLESEISAICARHGLVLDWEDEAAVQRTCDSASDPLALATLLDLLGEVAQRASHAPRRDAFTRAARALDPDPQRDAIRAALLAQGATEIDLLAADAAVATMAPRTALLLGLAQLRLGRAEEAVETWEGALLDAPADATLHRLVAWQLATGGELARSEARRHLEAVAALLPASRRVREEIDALGG